MRNPKLLPSGSVSLCYLVDWQPPDRNIFIPDIWTFSNMVRIGYVKTRYGFTQRPVKARGHFLDSEDGRRTSRFLWTTFIQTGQPLTSIQSG